MKHQDPPERPTNEREYLDWLLQTLCDAIGDMEERRGFQLSSERYCELAWNMLLQLSTHSIENVVELLAVFAESHVELELLIDNPTLAIHEIHKEARALAAAEDGEWFNNALKGGGA